MIDFDIKKIDQINLCQSDEEAVFLLASDGCMLGVNNLAIKLISEGGLFEKFLPIDHSGLVRACLKTRQSLKRKRDLDGLNIIWTYQVIDKVEKDKLEYLVIDDDKKDYICLSAQGFSKSVASSWTDRLVTQSINTSLPEMLFKQNGELECINTHAKQWLVDFKLVEIKGMLPFNHHELIQICFSEKTSLTEARVIDGKTYVWTYESFIDGVKVFARDLSVIKCKIPEHKEFCIKIIILNFRWM